MLNSMAIDWAVFRDLQNNLDKIVYIEESSLQRVGGFLHLKERDWAVSWMRQQYTHPALFLSLSDFAKRPANFQGSNHPMETILLETKIRIPSLSERAVHRGRLIDGLEDNLGDFKLALVSAPAGYGKTTALA